MRLAAPVVLAALLVSSCHATATVVVTETRPGAGEVAVHVDLDRQTVARLGDPATALRTADLAAAGWVADPVTARDDGSVTVGVHHPFASIREANKVLASISPAIGVALGDRHGVVSGGAALNGWVDLREGIDAIGDDKVAERLAPLQANGAATPDVSVAVVANLPGNVAHASAGGVIRGHQVTWTVPLGQRVMLQAATRAADGSRTQWYLAAAGLLLLLVVVMVAERARRRPVQHDDRWSAPRRVSEAPRS